MIKIDKIQPETIIYGVLIIAAAWWLAKTASAASDKYNPLDKDNIINKTYESGVYGDVIKNSNPILAAVEIGLAVAKKEYEILKGAILN